MTAERMRAVGYSKVRPIDAADALVDFVHYEG